LSEAEFSNQIAGSGELVARGARTHLRRPAASDQAEYCQLRRESAAFHAQWEPAPPPGVDAFGALMFQRYLAGSREPRRERYLLVRNEDDAIVGGLNLNEIVRGAFQSAYLGYWMGVAHVRRGYMSEGLRLLLTHAFGPLGLHRLEANIRPENAASIALVRSAGFRKEGCSARYLQIDGEWRDHERWAILAEDWPLP
jgi:[ribosomal protein S5]-alanine N-acetyltransferase